MSLYGVAAWERYGDAFAVYFGLFARLSPLRWERGHALRAPAAGGRDDARRRARDRRAAVHVIGTTTFDGFSEDPFWSDLAPDITDVVRRRSGFSAGDARCEIAFTLGLLAVVALVGAAVPARRRRACAPSPPERSTTSSRGTFAHTLVPIALAYVVAHYFSLLAYQGQALAYLASDPLGHVAAGTRLFGTADGTIDYTWIGSANGIWYVQVGALVLGHVAGLVLAHDRALVVVRPTPREATRSQYWMLVVMVAFTTLGLWLLSAARSRCRPSPTPATGSPSLLYVAAGARSSSARCSGRAGATSAATAGSTPARRSRSSSGDVVRQRLRREPVDRASRCAARRLPSSSTT